MPPGAKNNFGAPMFKPEDESKCTASEANALFRKQMHCFESKCTVSEANALFWKMCLWHCCDFFAPSQWFSARAIVTPCPPRYVSGAMQWNWENFPKRNKFSNPNLMNFYSINIRNFRTQYGMNLAQTANKVYWQHFLFLRVVFVSLLCLPYAFFRRGPVFVFLIIKLFRNSTSYLFKIR